MHIGGSGAPSSPRSRCCSPPWALRTLEDPRCEVVREATLADARRRLASERFDAIFSDLGLPDSHGAATIAALDDAGKGTPIVVLSGSDEAPPGRRFLRKGSIGPADLARVLKEAVG